MNRILRAANKLKERLTARGLILMYHRIAKPELDPWGLSVSPEHFAEQLEVIRNYLHPLSMHELLEHLQRGKVPNRSVVVTFDDGYVDNLQHGKSLLERFDVPGTIFLVTEALLEDRNFWWDDLAWALLQPETLPECLELNIDGSSYEWQLGEARRYSRHEQKKDWQRRPWDASSGTRLAFFYQVWQRLQATSKPERQKALDVIGVWAGVSRDPRPEDRALTQEEVRLLGDGSLVELGAHTVTHASLHRLPASLQMEEIAGSKAQLETILGRPVTSFSYPHGEYSAETLELVRRAGFQCASTTDFRCVLPTANPFELPRFQVDDWSGEEFLRRMARWYALS